MIVYALLVGINQYQAFSVPRLNGCVNDATAVQTFLRGRVTSDLRDLLLLDAEATRKGIIDNFRGHLGQARPGDVALFWYSGHGSQQRTPEDFWFVEPLGVNSTIVCADSRTNGVPDLADKELSVLIDEVAAKGPHVVVVLDCCHSGGGTRDPEVAIRGFPAGEDGPAVGDYLPELAARAAPDGGPRASTTRDVGTPITVAPFPVGDHVALSACQPQEKAKEQNIDGAMRGVFTASVLGALKTLGAGATYRDLLSTAKCRVENAASDQVPVLFPVDVGGIGDQPFLGGSVSRPATSFVLRHVRGAWEVDAGLVHGIPSGSADDAVVLAVAQGAGEDAGKQVRVTEVQADSSLVTPLGWTPDTARQYPVVVTSVPLPPAAVVLGGMEGDDDAAIALVAEVMATAGPGGGPSPHVRAVEAGDPAPGLRLRVSTVAPDPAPGPVYRILRSDVPVTADVPGHSEQSAGLVVSRLEHVAKWSHVKELENPASTLAGLVKLEVVVAQPAESTAPKDREALVPDALGEVRLAYSSADPAAEPPRVFIRIRNTSDRRLWCVLLDLTDRFRISPALFPGEFVAAGGVGAARKGKPVTVSLPPGRPVVGGAVVRDWLKLIVAEEEFGSGGYELPALDEPPPRSSRSLTRGVLGRLGRAATLRDMDGDDDEDHPGDWATAIIPIVTVVPG